MITNHKNIPLVLAVWAVHDEYEYIKEDNYISATGLMKPLRHIVLPRRVPKELRVGEDVDDYLSRAFGHSLHDASEKAWKVGYRENLAKLGYPPAMIDRVKINPEDSDLTPDTIPVYLEQRAFREINVDGRVFKVGGKYDCIAEGIVHDIKTTGVFGYMKGGRDEDYIIQGSIYRWLNPDKVTGDIIRICFVFTDWQKFMAKQNPSYPQSRSTYKEYKLWSIEKTEQWIKNKLRQVMLWQNADEELIPECTDEELWVSETVYKYYADPAKAAAGGRSTKNFDTDAAAAMKYWKVDKAGKGIVITVQGSPKRCGFCSAFPICSQQKKYSHD